MLAADNLGMLQSHERTVTDEQLHMALSLDSVTFSVFTLSEHTPSSQPPETCQTYKT
jgi:hypothetical protein